MTNLTTSFESSLHSKSEEARSRHWFTIARKQQEKREKLIEKEETGVVAQAIDAILANDVRIREFSAKLDNYETATVQALMVNQKQLDEVQAQIQILLEQAHIMEDGRRVFKSADGTWTIDEFGKEVTGDELDFDLIDSTKPTAEEYLATKKFENDLMIERQELINFQEKLDESRDKIADGE